MKYKLAIRAIRASAIALIGASLAACDAPLEEYQKFATAGKEYAEALDTLLVTSGNYFVDAQSEQLLRDDSEDENSRESNKERIRIYYLKSNESADRWLLLIGQMRQHTDLIEQYFISLENLATSNTPAQAQQDTERIFNKLNLVSTEIKDDPLVSQPIASALSQVTQIVLSEKIEGALREELEQRKEAIYRELAVQESVLRFLTIQLKGDLEIIQNSRDHRLLWEPYIASERITNSDEWITKRRNILTMKTSLEALNDASQSSQKFKESFRLLLKDEFTMERANALLSDINSLLDVAEELKQATNKPKDN